MTRPDLTCLLAPNLNELEQRLGEDPELEFALTEFDAFFAAAGRTIRSAADDLGNAMGAELAQAWGHALSGIRSAFGCLSAVHPERGQPQAGTVSELPGLLGGLLTRNRVPAQAVSPALPPRLRLRAPDVMDALRAGLEAWDRSDAVPVAPAEPTPVAPSWADDDELLDLLQDLLADSHAGDVELALERVARLPRELRGRHGIDVQHYDGSNDELFEVQQGSTLRSLRPALLTGGTILRRGLAHAPSPTVRHMED